MAPSSYSSQIALIRLYESSIVISEPSISETSDWRRFKVLNRCSPLSRLPSNSSILARHFWICSSKRSIWRWRSCRALAIFSSTCSNSRSIAEIEPLIPMTALFATDSLSATGSMSAWTRAMLSSTRTPLLKRLMTSFLFLSEQSKKPSYLLSHRIKLL